MEKPNFLIEKYADLPGSKPVERAIQKKIREGEKGATSKEARVQAYLDRLREFFEMKQPRRGQGGIELKSGFEKLKGRILDQYTTKFEEIPESYWKAQEEEARRRGEAGDWAQATEEQKAEVRRKHAEVVLTDQRASLEQWLDYFSLPDCTIPDNLKYWIFRNILNLKELVKNEVKKPDGTLEQKIEFPKRSKGTVAPFPDLNQEALGYVVDAIDKKIKGQQMEFEHDIQPEERAEFQKFLTKEDFAKLYAWANELMSPIPKHLLPITEGMWVKYDQGSNPESLVKTIRGKGTGWCTAGLNTAETQLAGGDFYAYYTLDDSGQAVHPRIAIRMTGHDQIAEDPRGIAYKQNLDPYMGPILEEKLKEFGSVGETYKKKSADMRRLTDIERKSKKNETLTRSDLIFLYEIEGQIEGFGYREDPRVAELLKTRNPKEDAPIVLDCQPEEIAWSPHEINVQTKTYVCKLEPGILETLEELGIGIEQIYTSFPQERIRLEKNFAAGPISLAEFQKQRELYNAKITDKSLQVQTNNYAEDMAEKIGSKEHPALKDKEIFTLVRLKVRDLFSDEQVHTTREIFEKADELGLELCPPETGLIKRLQDTNQPMDEWYYIAMKPITDRYGGPHVFGLARDADGLGLGDGWARPGREWYPDVEFAFRLRKNFLSAQGIATF